MATSDDDRIAYLAGEPGRSLTPQERAELDERDALLEAPATWAAPDPGLEDRVVAAIAEEARARPASARPRRPAFQLRLRVRLLLRARRIRGHRCCGDRRRHRGQQHIPGAARSEPARRGRCRSR